ncbi:MAG: (2Fe-2S) ferredoxin domain-containing protein [Magnetospirillum sp.]|nr:(2Fe-2S) ferredoxin domain-containing protein [Magnetospirillum sp.]
MRTDPPLYYRIHVFACTNRRPEGHPRGSCAARGSERLRDYMKARAKELGLDGVRINSAGCLDRCELGPVMVIYPEGVWYAYRNHDDIDEILRVHLVEGGRVERLILTPNDQPILSA